MDNRLNFKHVISPITFTSFNWAAHKIKCVFKCLSGSEPCPLEKLRLGAMVPSEASTIQVTKDGKSFSTFCQIAKLWNFAHTGPGNIVYHS